MIKTSILIYFNSDYLSPVRRAITILVMICILFQSGGVLLYYQLSFLAARHEMEQRLKQGVDFHELTVIDLSHDDLLDLEWKKQGREFRFEYEMYDVVNKEKTSTGMRFYCICDKKETQIRNNIANFTNKHRDQKTRSAHNAIVKIVKLLKKQRNDIPSYVLFTQPSAKLQHSEKKFTKHFASPSLLSPFQPPELI